MRVLIVDDDKLVSISLKTILEASQEIEVTGIGNNGEEAITLFEEDRPDVLLMDIRMDVMTGLEAAKVILAKHSDARILFLTTFTDDDYIVKALNLGAKGYILKQDFESILPALQAVMRGQTVYGDEVGARIPDLIASGSEFDFEAYGLLEKEFDIMKLVAHGKNNKEIAEELFLSEGTVRNYLSVLLEKLQLRDRTQLAIFYYQNK